MNDFNILLFLVTNFSNGLIAILIFAIGYLVLDKLTPKQDFTDAFRKEKVTNGGIIMSAFILAIGLVLAFASS